MDENCYMGIQHAWSLLPGRAILITLRQSEHWYTIYLYSVLRTPYMEMTTYSIKSVPTLW